MDGPALRRSGQLEMWNASIREEGDKFGSGVAASSSDRELPGDGQQEAAAWSTAAAGRGSSKPLGRRVGGQSDTKRGKRGRKRAKLRLPGRADEGLKQS